MIWVNGGVWAYPQDVRRVETRGRKRHWWGGLGKALVIVTFFDECQLQWGFSTHEEAVECAAEIYERIVNACEDEDPDPGEEVPEEKSQNVVDLKGKAA